MLIHHFYPQTQNLGDHFVQRGIVRLVHRLAPDAEFKTFSVNSRGAGKEAFGLTVEAANRANREADFIIVGGSNLFEGRDTWGIHVEPDFYRTLKVPLVLLGIGTGSGFRSQPPRPSAVIQKEIARLHEHAILAGARDIVTLEWLSQLGIKRASLTGDPATFIFNRARQPTASGDHVLIAAPPIRYWDITSRREYFDPRRRKMFRALRDQARRLKQSGHRVLLVCNDPPDLKLALNLFDAGAVNEVICPTIAEHYFDLLGKAKAVISGRLHTAVVSFSLGIPFALIDVDQRTSGFIKTYGLYNWAVAPSFHVRPRLDGIVGQLFDERFVTAWEELIRRRDAMHDQALNLLGSALKPWL